jgi:hypothetical protein
MHPANAMHKIFTHNLFQFAQVKYKQEIQTCQEKNDKIKVFFTCDELMLSALG